MGIFADMWDEGEELKTVTKDEASEFWLRDKYKEELAISKAQQFSGYNQGL